MSFRSIITNQGLTEKIASAKKFGYTRTCADCGDTAQVSLKDRPNPGAKLTADLKGLSSKTSILYRKRQATTAKAMHDALLCPACGSDGLIYDENEA